MSRSAAAARCTMLARAHRWPINGALSRLSGVLEAWKFGRSAADIGRAGSAQQARRSRAASAAAPAKAKVPPRRLHRDREAGGSSRRQRSHAQSAACCSAFSCVGRAPDLDSDLACARRARSRRRQQTKASRSAVQRPCRCRDHPTASCSCDEDEVLARPQRVPRRRPKGAKSAEERAARGPAWRRRCAQQQRRRSGMSADGASERRQTAPRHPAFALAVRTRGSFTAAAPPHHRSRGSLDLNARRSAEALRARVGRGKGLLRRMQEPLGPRSAGRTARCCTPPINLTPLRSRLTSTTSSSTHSIAAAMAAAR